MSAEPTRTAPGDLDGRPCAPRPAADPGTPAPVSGPAHVSRLAAWARRIVTAPIAFYRRVLSPLKPATCRFSPTCSAYAHEAILRHGVFRGGALAAWRILRCQPFARAGYDPVPGTAPTGDRDHGSGHT